MESITITRPVIVKVRVTESYKKAVAVEIQNAVQKIDMQMQHLEFQARRIITDLEKQNPNGVAAAREQIEMERRRKLDSRQKLVDKLKEIGKISPGEEMIHSRLESLVELRVGDLWEQVMGVEIILEDGKVIEIRQAGEERI